jgi:16S rRNA (cytosine967-C5)-methyltransferase
MPLSPARRTAFEVLRRVETQGSYADDLLRARLRSEVRADDAALATELTFGVLRWRRLLDFLIEQALNKSDRSLDVEVRITLRMGVYQLWFLKRIPPRAAIHESVELVKHARKRSAASLVNAVLRKGAESSESGENPQRAAASRIPADLPLAERLGILYSHPDWLVERWLRAYGQQRTQSLLEANNRAPAPSFTVPEINRREEVFASLAQAGCSIEPGRLLQHSWRLRGGNPNRSDAVRHGGATLQDEASQAVAHLVAARPGDFVLDLCAAPGGKTLLLAHAAGAEGRVVAVDLHEHRVRAMAERFERGGVRNVEPLVMDATRPFRFERPFDRILVDAPCSGTGTLARHPEVRWRLRPSDLADLHARQVNLLCNALPHLAAAGRLVYSTCSLEPEENESVVNEVLAATPHNHQIIRASGALESFVRPDVAMDRIVSTEGFFRTFPADYETDGFFAAVVEPIERWHSPEAGNAAL